MKKITVIGHYGMSLLMDVEHLAAIGETVEGLGLALEPGGKGYNQAIAASRQGASVNFITSVGGDDFGARCDTDLISEGVEGRYILSFPEEKTACAFVINSQSYESNVYVYPGSIRSVTPEHIRQYKDVIAKSGLLLLQNEISEDSLCEAIRIGADAGIPIIYNPAPARAMPEWIYGHIEILTPNETEAAILTGQDPHKAADPEAAITKFQALGVKYVIVTLGEKGSLLAAEDKRYAILPLTGEVVSTTGAGDCFNAALATKYLETGDVYLAARYASVASGMQVMRPGVIANLPYRDETEEMFAKYKGAEE